MVIREAPRKGVLYPTKFRFEVTFHDQVKRGTNARSLYNTSIYSIQSRVECHTLLVRVDGVSSPGPLIQATANGTVYMHSRRDDAIDCFTSVAFKLTVHAHFSTSAVAPNARRPVILTIVTPRYRHSNCCIAITNWITNVEYINIWYGWPIIIS
jgi:hypothetical protein